MAERRKHLYSHFCSRDSCPPSSQLASPSLDLATDRLNACFARRFDACISLLMGTECTGVVSRSVSLLGQGPDQTGGAGHRWTASLAGGRFPSARHTVGPGRLWQGCDADTRRAQDLACTSHVRAPTPGRMHAVLRLEIRQSMFGRRRNKQGLIAFDVADRLNGPLEGRIVEFRRVVDLHKIPAFSFRRQNRSRPLHDEVFP